MLTEPSSKSFLYVLLIIFMSPLCFSASTAGNNVVEPPFQYLTPPLLNADQRFLPTQLIVRLKPQQSLTEGASLDSLFSLFYFQTGERLSLVRELALNRRFVVTLTKGKSPTQISYMIKLLQAFSQVESVEEDIMLRHTASPNDTLYSQQWPLFELMAGIAADETWPHSTGNNAIVAILDTGYTDHQDLTGSLIAGYDFITDISIANDGNGRDSDAHDPGDWMESWDCGVFNPPNFVPSSWHGTHTMGTVGAVANNNRGIAGVAFHSKIVPVRVLGKCGGRTSDITDAIIWASGGSISGVANIIQPANIISMSLGANGSCSPAFQAAINTAINNGSVVIAAAGNDQQNFVNHQPSNCSGVISVASTDRQGNRAYYSNYGNVTISAPGGETASVSADGVLSTYNTGSRGPQNDAYAFAQGTSMAAPHVAGVAALLYQLKPNLLPTTVKDILTATARPALGNCSGCGAGIVNAASAVMSLNTEPLPNQPPVADFSFMINDLNVSFSQTSSDNDGLIISSAWQFGDANSSTEQNPQHAYASSGTYNVSLTVTDNLGANATTIKTVNVNSAPMTGINLSHTWAKLYSSGRLRVRLRWDGATSNQVDLYFNGQVIMTTKNDGRQTHRTSNIEPGTMTYLLCEANTNNCSEPLSIDF